MNVHYSMHLFDYRTGTQVFNLARQDTGRHFRSIFIYISAIDIDAFSGDFFPNFPKIGKIYGNFGLLGKIYAAIL